MLPEFYQKHLKSQLSTADFILLKIVITILQSIKQVNLERLANALPLPIQFVRVACPDRDISRRKKLQRFISLPSLDIQTLWFPIVQEWLDKYFDEGKVIYIAIDRTNWGSINLFMISVVWDKRAFPIYFELLAKLGSSNIDEQSSILSKVIPIF